MLSAIWEIYYICLHVLTGFQLLFVNSSTYTVEYGYNEHGSNKFTLIANNLYRPKEFGISVFYCIVIGETMDIFIIYSY